MEDLKYNTNALKNFKNKVDTLINELNDAVKDLNSSLEELKNDWDTPTGRQFFIENKCDWETEVKKYIQLLNHLSAMIACSIGSYDQVTSYINLVCMERTNSYELDLRGADSYYGKQVLSR